MAEEYTDMDTLAAMVAKLPKLQQAILHAQIQEQFKQGLTHEVKSAVSAARAAWLYL